MYLKALEIQGFKSFPDKTRLTFEKNITAIVGPNGSGKSNISDAIRWVMGEQSTRTLRGGKMEDVIFGGTERRNQVGFAEVSLILDNSHGIFSIDAQEVMITRRYYRSGDSEYALNRETVRLKDIHEILMDTGMGRDGYAIIDQGRVGEIISSKSVDRRDIFEEAAGISRYRHRKEESERKLDRTDENLTRINDKIAELELQREPLRKQSQVAKKYLLLRDELRGLEISLWMEQLDKLRAESIRLSADYETAGEQLRESQETLEQMYRESEMFSENMRNKDISADRIRSDISAVEAEAADGESAVAVLSANLKSGGETIERLRGELSEQSGRRDTLKSQIEDRKARVIEIQEQSDQLYNKTQELLSKVSEIAGSMGTGAGQLDSLMKQESQETMELSREREKLSALASSVQAMYDRDAACAADLAQAKAKLEEVASQRDGCLDELQGEKNERDTLVNMICGREMKMKGRTDKADRLKNDLSRLTLEHGSVKNRIGLLEEMEREYQGFTKAVKLVMQEAGRGRLRGIHGPVANLLHTDDRYALAIETALGGASQNIVVDTPEDGKYAITYLKRTKGGRATFLPISSIRGNRLMEKGLEKSEGFVGIALDLVRFEPRLESIYKNILGRTVIVETLDDAIRIAKAYGNRFKLVSLDGQVISAGGSMTGGSAGKTAGILSRANEIKKLESRERELEKELRGMRDELDAVQRELRGVSEELDVSRNELRQIEDSILRLEAGVNTHEMLLSSIQDTCYDLEEEIVRIGSRVEADTEKITQLRESISNRVEAIAGYRSRADELTRGQEDLNAAREELNRQLVNFQAERASLEAEGDATRRSIDELEALASDIFRDREQKERQISSLEAEQEEIKAQIVQRELEIQGCRERIDQLRRELTRVNEMKLELEARRNSADKVMQERNRDILRMERECSRLEQRKLAADMEEKQIIDKLWDTYELSHSAAAQIRQQLESVQEASREAARLKKEIAALGTPNIGAIDEFDRVDGRYTYLTGQRDDIEKAKRELQEIIHNITEEMESIFSRSFEMINHSFKETFTELFGGGKADLELEDPEDILNCGIEIKVQPPGKSLKTITLLSGGEKSFVAIALYFAIQKIKPTPFCVMDEIEAALDEANVLRFAQYMRSLSHKTQFIAITHRRGTMEEADMLYGVTMQEQGVSKVLSIDLEEAEMTIQAS